MAPERVPPRPFAFSSLKDRYPHFYSFLYQVLLLIVIFECDLAIARYDPLREDAESLSAPISFPRSLLRPVPRPGQENSTTPHICKYEGREDYVDLGSHLIAITPYAVLCPSTPFFLLSLVIFIICIIKFGRMHKEDVVVGPYPLAWWYLISTSVMEGRNTLVALQSFAPTLIWVWNVFLAVTNWLFSVCFPRTYQKRWEAKKKWLEEWKKREEEKKRAKLVQSQREGDRDVEAGVEGEVGDQAGYELQSQVDEATPLRS